MSGDAMAPPEPKEIDETRSMELRHLSTNAMPARPAERRRAVRELPLLPREHRGRLVLLAPEAAHPRRRDWSCQWWESTLEA